MGSLGAGNRFLQRGNLVRRQSLGAGQLVEVGFGNDQLCGPLNLLLVLHVQVSNLNGLGGVDCGVRQVLGGSQLHVFKAPGNFRDVDESVVPVSGPFSAENQHSGIDGTAIEVGDFEWLRRVCEVNYRDTTLIPALHFDVATGYWNQ
jgi:hypothetical protein